mmetsp:Transcript_9254/g.20078  ORF Transcript_9254/g.20078 Transcript_9254/m.20078 type:complete len:241 (+) Transcript_9254:938-1660(+)
MQVGSMAMASSYAANASWNFLALYRLFPSSFFKRAFFWVSFFSCSSGESVDQSSSMGVGTDSSFFVGAGAGADDADDSSPPPGDCPIKSPSISIIFGSLIIVGKRLGFCWIVLILAMIAGSSRYCLNRGSMVICASIVGLKRPPPGGPPPMPIPAGGPSFSRVTSSKPFLRPASLGNFSSPSLYAAMESLYRFKAWRAAPFLEYPFVNCGLRAIHELASSSALFPSPLLRYAAERLEKYT